MTAVSDRGRVRKQNQDRIFNDPENGLFILADGVGGRAGGEVASQLTVDVISRELLRAPLWRRLWPWASANAPSLARLGEAVLAAHNAIIAHAHHHPRLEGMSSTVVAGLLQDEHCLCASVGDSRLYRLRDGELQQLSRDQTLARKLVREGFIAPGDRRLARYEHILTSVLGRGDTPRMQLFQTTLRPGDCLLACSDGLSGMLDDDAICQILRQEQPLRQRAEQLVEAANQAGGRDNVSLILVQPAPVTAPSAQPIPAQGEAPCHISI